MKRCLLCLLLLPLSAIAQTVPVGWIDNSFGKNGSDTISNSTITLLSVFTGDSLISVGDGGAFGAIIASKFDNNGQICTSFGTNGSVLIYIPGYENYYAQCVVVQPDGKILIAGNGSDTNSNPATSTFDDFLIVRLMPNGSFDTSFHKTGILGADFDHQGNELSSIALQPDGKILASGTTTTDTGQRLELARFNSNGSIDSTFGTFGRAEIPLPNSYGMYVTLQPNGKIIVGGSWGGGNNATNVIMRFNSTGTLDSTFGINGQNMTIPSSDAIFSLQSLSNGKFLTSGETDINRYNSDGSLDSTFGTNGAAYLNIRFNINNSCSVAIAPNGKLLYTVTEDSIGFAVERLARFSNNGTLDTTFGFGGVVQSVVPEIKVTYISYMHAVQVQSSGKIVASGFYQTSLADGFGFLTRYYQASTDVPTVPLPSIQLSVYPNPSASGIFSVGLPNYKNTAQIIVADMQGRAVWIGTHDFTASAARIDLTANAAGAYVVKIVTFSGERQTALVIKK